MSLVQESYLIHLLNQCDAFSTRQEKQSKEAVTKRLDEIYRIFKRNIRETFNNFSLDVIVRFSQIAVQIQQKLKYAEEFVQLFFQRIEASSQFYIRQLLVKAKVIAFNGHNKQLKGQEIVQIIKQSIYYISKSLDLISGGKQQNVPKGKQQKGAQGAGDSSKVRYGFLVYNASTCLYKITRFMLKSSWQKNFTQIFQRIYKLFQELDQPDHNWRSRFSLILFQCLYDNDKKPDSFKVLDLLWQKTKTKNCDFQDSLFRLRIHLSKQNNALAAVIKKDIQANPGLQWGVLQVLQRIKSGYIPEVQVQKQLMTVVNTIYDGVLSTTEQTTAILSPIKQQRLAQAGRLALKYNLLSIATPITTFLTKARQPNQKAMVLNEYNKAQLLIKKKGEFIDKKTGMMMSPQQIKTLQVEYRKEALKILEKVMIINRKLDNDQLIYEGAVLVWNISLPFMCPQYRNSIIKSFQVSSQLLQQIDSIDHDLRTKIHLELAKAHFGNQAMFVQVESNVMKAIKLDHSIAISKLQYKFQPEQDPSLYQRPYERYLEDFRQKILLKTMQNIEPTPLDIVTQDLWNVAQQKSQTTRIDILQKCLRTLITHQQDQFEINEEEMLVQEQIKVKKIQFQRNKIRLYKRKKILTAQIAQFSFEWELNDFSKKACEFVLSDTWQGKNSIQLIIVQSKCCYFMAQMKIDQLNQMNFQLPFEEAITVNQEDSLEKLNQSEQKKKQVKQRKQQIFEYLKKGLELAESIQQHWLVFNGAIYLWNNCLHIFRNPSNDSKLKTQLVLLLQKFFQAMKKSLSEIQAKNIVYYDLDNKIQTFANIGLVYARLRELQKKSEQVLKICESLLNTSLSPHTRKLINGIKARVQKSGNIKQADPKKGGKQPPKSSATTNDSFVLEILTQLQIIQNTTNKSQTQNLLKKCFQSLQTWKPKQQDQTELQLHAQLWVRLARLSLNQNSIQMFKYSLRCCQYALGYLQKKDKQKQTNVQGTKTAMSLKSQMGSIPANRLRWYSLAQFLYSQGLIRICNPDSQQLQSVYKLRFTALDRAVQAAFKGYKCNINILVLDAAKQVWNICAKLQQTQANRFKLLKPIKTTLFYLKEMKEDSEVDLILLLSELYFKTCFQNNQFKAGQDMVDRLLGLVPKNLQKSLWEAKMVFMSKQGKNQLHAISSMKQADPSLQAKLWVKLARVSVNPSKQHTAYNKALDILKKENSVQIVQVLMEYAEWQTRIGNQSIQSVSSTLLLAADYLIDIQYGQEDDEDIDDDKNTVFSRSTRGKKSQISKSAKSSVRQKAKKIIDKKGPMSIKSKNSGVSRMNKSGRVTKTIKSKNTKSIFSQKQEDPNPDSLNCVHFQRLFRIHTTLAMISSDPQDRIRYALDAKQFLIKIYELSLKTLNELQQNATKFAQKSEKKQNYKKLQLPKCSQEWIKLDFPKQFVQRIKSLQNYNFMGSFTFEKPQLTFIYIDHLIDIFEKYGLSLHTLPAYFLNRYLAKYVLQNPRLHTLCQLKLKRMLIKTKFSQEQLKQIQINFADQKVTEHEHKKEIIKAQGYKTMEKDQNLLFEDSAPPNLIKQFANYMIWAKIGQVFIDFGEISLAKHLLIQAQTPAKILSDSEYLAKIYKCLSKISYIQGEFATSMDYSLISNKLCKSTKEWSQIILQTCCNLLNLKKFENLKKYLNQIHETINELLEQAKEQLKQKQNLHTQLIQMKDILLLVNMLKVEQKFYYVIQQENTQTNVAQLNRNLKVLREETLVNQNFIKGNLLHFNLFKKIAQNIFKLYQTGGGRQCIDLNFNIFNGVFDILFKIEKILIQIGKYCFIGGADYYSNTLSLIHKQIRFLIVQGYQIKQLLGQKNVNINQQQIDKVQELGLNYQPLKKYLNTLTTQINKKMSPIPTNLQPCESGISILQNLRPSISSDSYQYVKWSSHYTICQTLRAISKKQLQVIWTNKDILQTSTSQYAALSIENSQDFIEQCEPKLVNYSEDILCHLNSQRGYYSLINNKGLQFPNKYFQFLAKYQHSCYTQFVIQTLKSKLSANHRYVSGQRIIQNIQLNKQFKDKILSNDIVNAYTTFPGYKQCFGMIPPNSMTIVIQLSNIKSELHFSCLINNGAQDKKYIVKKKSLLKNDIKMVLSMKQSMNKVKKNMIKSPFQDQSKIEETIQQNQEILMSMQKKFIDFNKWWLDQIVYLVNQPKQIQQQEVDPKDKDKKGVKDQKKSGKDQISSYKCSIPATPSGIQSITFLLDQFLYNLPFQHLVGLQNVPAVSKDTSLFYMCRKLQKLNYQSELNNSSGFGSEKGKFLAFDFKKQQANFSSMLPEISKAGIKLDGFSSTKRIPSPGDTIYYMSEPGFLHIYGSINYLNIIKLPGLLTLLPTIKTHLMILTDNLNYRKQILNKFAILTDGFETPTQKQEEVIIVCANLLNITLIKNRWTERQQKMMNNIKQWYRKLGQGLYVGCIGRHLANKQHKQKQNEQKLSIFSKIISFVHGPAVLRM